MILSLLHCRHTPHRTLTQVYIAAWVDMAIVRAYKETRKEQGPRQHIFTNQSGPRKAGGSHLSPEPVRNKHFTHTPLTSRKGNSSWVCPWHSLNLIGLRKWLCTNAGNFAHPVGWGPMNPYDSLRELINLLKSMSDWLLIKFWGIMFQIKLYIWRECLNGVNLNMNEWIKFFLPTRASR